MMTRKTIRRRHRPARVDSMWDALDRSQPTPPDVVLEIMVRINTAHRVLLDGKGDDNTADVLGAVMNVGLIRAAAIAPELVAIFDAGSAAMVEAQRIYSEHGRYGFTGPGLIAIEDALSAYEELLRASSPMQMQLAAAEATRRVARMQAEKEKGQPA